MTSGPKWENYGHFNHFRLTKFKFINALNYGTFTKGPLKGFFVITWLWIQIF